MNAVTYELRWIGATFIIILLAPLFVVGLIAGAAWSALSAGFKASSE